MLISTLRTLKFHKGGNQILGGLRHKVLPTNCLRNPLLESQLNVGTIWTKHTSKHDNSLRLFSNTRFLRDSQKDATGQSSSAEEEALRQKIRSILEKEMKMGGTMEDFSLDAFLKEMDEKIASMDKKDEIEHESPWLNILRDIGKKHEEVYPKLHKADRRKLLQDELKRLLLEAEEEVKLHAKYGTNLKHGNLDLESKLEGLSVYVKHAWSGKDMFEGALAWCVILGIAYYFLSKKAQTTDDEPLPRRRLPFFSENVIMERLEDWLKGFERRPVLLPSTPPGSAPSMTLVIDPKILCQITWDHSHGYRVKKRPGADFFLWSIAPHYEIILFSDADFSKAGPFYDRLDPSRGFISYRIYREGTFLNEGRRVKNFQGLERPLSSLVILETKPYNCEQLPTNCLLLPASKGDANDTTLLDAIPFLKEIAKKGNAQHMIAALKGTTFEQLEKEIPARA